MAKATKGKDSVEIEVMEVESASARYCVLGMTPLIPRTMSSKNKWQLLKPPKRKTAAEKAVTEKHDVYDEFHTSAIRLTPPSDTLLAIPGAAFRKAIATAAIDTPGGASRAQLGRLTRIEQYNVGIYGIPFLLMSVVRSADIARTPDIRTRVIVPEWAAFVTVEYQTPMLTLKVISQLLASAGRTVGVGDWRQEKGSGSHGLWKLVSEDDAEFERIVKHFGRAAQEVAMKEAAPFDEETAELLGWYNDAIAASDKKKSEVKAK